MWSEINHYNDLKVEFYVSYCKNLLNEKNYIRALQSQALMLTME